MQLQTIKFTADEQSLQRTSGGSLFASSTVSYIRALFDLGDNWGSWGAVRAVWKSRTQQIATVLTDGACMVPAEVLANPGQVYVNLVASEVSGNVVTDRLTSYPVLALVVDAQALVDGSETAEITPSQFEQFVEAVEGYSSQAIDARDRAEAAQEAAETAQGKAEDAQEAAETAQEKAETAQGKAEDAQGFAEEASTAAGNSAADADRSEGEAAAWATGSYSGDGGIPVPASAPQHHNNAKYYSEQAESALNELESASATASTLPAGSSATASYSDGNFAFGIPKGDKGDTGNTGATGPAAGFGEVSATVDANVGTPSVEVSASGPDTAKQFSFAFYNLKGEQGEKGDPGEVTNEDLWDVLPTDSASGAIASFSDGAKNVPLKSLVVNIEPVQDLHGYDNPWPEGGSKNVCFNPTGDFSTSSFPNIYYPSGDGLGITVNNSLYTAYAKVEKNTNYTFSCFGTPQRHIAYGLDGYPAVDVICHSLTVSGSGSAWTFNSGNYEYVAFYYCNDIPNAPTKIQIEKGTSATSYAPYEANICPISGWTGATVTRCGGNLYDATNFPMTSGRYINHNTGATATADAFDCTIDYIPISPAFIGQTMKWNCENHGGSAPGFAWYDAQKVYISGAQVFPAVVPHGAAYLRFTVKHGQTNIMLYIGNTPASYEPYNANVYPITWVDSAGMVYGGTLDVTTGVLTVDKAIQDLGALTWTKNTNTNVFDSGITGKAGGDFNILCSAYPVSSGATISAMPDVSIKGHGTSDLIYVKDSGYSTEWANNDTAAFKSAMSGVQLVYELATHLEYTLTPAELTTLLGQNNIWADTGDTAAKYRADIQLFINKMLANALSA